MNYMGNTFKIAIYIIQVDLLINYYSKCFGQINNDTITL